LRLRGKNAFDGRKAMCRSDVRRDFKACGHTRDMSLQHERLHQDVKPKRPCAVPWHGMFKREVCLRMGRLAQSRRLCLFCCLLSAVRWVGSAVCH
jgi:hypothetical protein